MFDPPRFGMTPFMQGAFGQRGVFGNATQGEKMLTAPRMVVPGAQLLNSFQPTYINAKTKLGPSAFYAKSPYDPRNFLP